MPRRDIVRVAVARFCIEHPAPPGGWEEVRDRLREALAADHPIRLEERWEDDRVHLRAAGAQATIQVVGGRLRAEADLKPPASFFGATIERELRQALERAWPVDAAGDPSQSKP